MSGGDDLKDRMPLARLALQGNGRLRHHVSLDQHIVRAGAPHPKRAPGVEHLHMRGAHRHAEVQHHRRLARAFEDGARHEKIAGRRPGGEDLARVDAIAALDLLGLAGARNPIGPAARQQQEAFVGDALEQWLHSRHLLVLPTPGRHGDWVGVHGEGERGGAAIVGERSQHGG
jgi:hypothetical protein